MENLLKNIIKYSISAILLCFIIYAADTKKMLDYLQKISLSSVWIAFSLALCQVLLTTLRWRLLLNALNIRLPFRLIAEINSISILANTVLINVLGGFLAKVTLLSQNKVHINVTTASFVLERLIILLVLLLMALVSVIFIAHEPFQYEIKISKTIVALIILFMFMMIMLQLNRMNKVGRYIMNIYRLILTELRRGLDKKKTLFNAFILTVVAQLTLIAIGVELARALVLNIPVIDLIMLLSIVSLLASAPISVSGIGVREVSMVYLFSMYSIPAEQSIILSLLILFFTLSGAIGLYLISLIFNAKYLYQKLLKHQLNKKAI